MRKIALLALMPFAVLLPPAPGAANGTVMAGVRVVDATWHVGASAGQYATDHPCSPADDVLQVVEDQEYPSSCPDGSTIDHLHNFDPNFHQTRRAPSYGIESRNSVRVILIEGDGTRVALMKNDLYIPQDLLNERIATILEEHDRRVMLGLEAGPVTGITHANLMVAVSHSHSSPYYSTPSWGVWTFQDVFDIRFFEYMAQQSAKAVIQAAASMVPVRMGAMTLPYDHGQRHSYGPARADDGTPAGYPKTDNDKTISVLRFDDVSAGEQNATPLAIFMTLGLHPEMLEGNNLITGEYVGALERMVEAETGATLIFAQNNTGTSEPDRNCEAHPCSARAEFSHREYGQAERVARSIADVVVDGFTHIGTADDPAVPVPFSSDFPVGIVDRQFAPPYSHPYPSVSNCRSHEAFDGNPGVPIVGLPDCERFAGDVQGGANDVVDAVDDETGIVSAIEEATGQDVRVPHPKEVGDMLDPLDPGVTYDTLRRAGIPLPDNYSAPSYTGLQETFQVHLQAIRLGDVLITVCPCEQWADQSRNIKTRADVPTDNIWRGFEWPCLFNPIPPTNWTCPHPSFPGGVATITNDQWLRVHAQINNDAAGWDEITHTVYAEYEPVDVTQIKGNFTHLEIQDYCPSCAGYALVVPVGMANDYWGYLASYREYQRGDHYRKALTGLGPHSQDFMATRLVRMGTQLQGGPEVAYNPLDLAYMVDGAHQHARAEVLGRDAQILLAGYEALLPPDAERLGGPIIAQPDDITRFDATSFTWVGGSNYTDDPHVKVQRETAPGVWEDYGDQRGDVVVTLDFPETGISSGGVDPGVSDIHAYLTSDFEWSWTATFEAFDSDIDTGSGSQTPVGDYRFVVDGMRRSAPATALPYHVESDPFHVAAWNGITVSGLGVSPSAASFVVGPVNTKTFCTGYAGCGSTVTATVGPIDYPDTWAASKLPTAPETGTKLFPREQRSIIGGNFYCFPCTFRPWADVSQVASAAVTVDRTANGGGIDVVSATCAGAACSASLSLGTGDCVSVEPGQIIDTFGETNAAGTTPVCLP